jgi:type IV pilus assembly protein PilC
MAEFLVKMADERGHVLQQLETGRSEVEVRERVAQQGFLVYSVRQRGVLTAGGVRFGRQRRIKPGHFLIFNQQFLTLIHAGLPIVASLGLLLRQQRDATIKNALENARDRVKGGETLSEALAAQGIFPPVYTTNLQAGEKSGNLEEVLRRYIGFQRVAVSFRKKLLASLIYPTILICAVLAMLTFLLSFVVPRFADLFKDLGAELPAITQFTISVGAAVQSYFVFLLLALLLVVAGVWRWKQTESGARRLDRARLRVPVLGSIWLKYQMAMFARTLATLLSGGMPLVPSLETAASSTGSQVMAGAVIEASRRVREGRPLSASFADTKVFPELTVEMIEVGESTGALPDMLNSVAEFYEQDVETALAAALSLIEPAILIFMALIVGFVLLSLYYPLFTLGAGGIK